MAAARSNWEKYYSTLKRMPKKLKDTAPFVTDAILVFKKHRVKKILDLGSGAGRHCILLASNDFDVVGIDLSKSALRMAKRWARKEKLENIGLLRATMTHIPLADRCLDAVISVSVMHHGYKKDMVTSVEEVHRILDRRGWFIANFASTSDPRYGTGQKLEKDTYSILERYEKKKYREMHHFFSKQEMMKSLSLFSKAKVVPMQDRLEYWKIEAIK